MTPEEYQSVFKLPFNEASSFFEKKLNIGTLAFDDLQKDQHAKGFMTAGANKSELLADFRGAVQQSIDGTMTLPQFQSKFDEIVATHGWSYNGSRNWRSELIYNTNVRTSYMAGRWQQLTDVPDGEVVYLVYRHADGVRHPRPEHVSWDGIILPSTDPWWTTHFPPNGWGCHCTVFRATAGEYRAAVAAGRVPPAHLAIDPKTEAPIGIDKGWDYNVGQAAESSYQILGNKFESLPNDIARAWMAEHVAGPAFERFMEGKISGEFPVAVLNEADKTALDTTTQTVWMSQETLSEHLTSHPDIALEDYRLIPTVLDQGEVYQQSDERLIYLQQGEKLYRAALKKTKDGTENYFLTLFTTSEEKAEIEVRKKYKRIR
jgi:hypothetical protein